jgi:hypothetical protein
MPRLLFLLTFFSLRAAAADIEPGMWEFTANVQAEGLGAFQPKPGPIVNQRCITKEEAANPEKALTEAGAKGQCTFSNQRNTGIQFNFDVRCTSPLPLSGSGTMRYTAEAMEGDLDLAGDMQGMQFKTRSHINARRLGPCNS